MVSGFRIHGGFRFGTHEVEQALHIRGDVADERDRADPVRVAGGEGVAEDTDLGFVVGLCNDSKAVADKKDHGMVKRKNSNGASSKSRTSSRSRRRRSKMRRRRRRRRGNTTTTIGCR